MRRVALACLDLKRHPGNTWRDGGSAAAEMGAWIRQRALSPAAMGCLPLEAEGFQRAQPVTVADSCRLSSSMEQRRGLAYHPW